MRDGLGPDTVAQAVERLDRGEVMEGARFLIGYGFELVALVEDEVESGLEFAMGFVQEFERGGFAGAGESVDHQVGAGRGVGFEDGGLFRGGVHAVTFASWAASD